MYHYSSINLPRIFCCLKLIYYFVSIKSCIFFGGGVGLVVIRFMNYWSLYSFDCLIYCNFVDPFPPPFFFLHVYAMYAGMRAMIMMIRLIFNLG